MKKQKSVLWITFFVCLIVLPEVLYVLLGRHMYSEKHENRNLAEKPYFAIENYDIFPNQFEEYYNDNVPFRNQLVWLNSAIDYFIFGQPSNNRVSIGKNGWLFYCDEEDSNPVGQSLGYWDFSDDELRKIAANLMSAKCLLNSRGIEFVLFIVPNKETIYVEELPDYYNVKNHYTAVDHLVDYLRRNTDIRIVYPKNEMVQIKEEYTDINLYYKLDTHWNSVGAYVGASSLARELGVELPSFDKVTLKSKNLSTGDLTNMLNITIPNGDIEYEVSWAGAIETEEKKWDFSKEFVYHTPCSNQLTLVVRRDSFSTALAPIMATQYEDSIWIHMWEFQPHQIFDYDADIFVYETAERYIQSLLEFRLE